MEKLGSEDFFEQGRAYGRSKHLEALAAGRYKNLKLDNINTAYNNNALDMAARIRLSNYLQCSTPGLVRAIF